MKNYFECKIRYEKTMENGKIKKMTEPYLVDALSFTEAEARIIEEVKPFISGEFTVKSIKRANISELFPCDSGDKWFKCKVMFITIDKRSGAEKKTASFMLSQASSIEESRDILVKGMKETLSDYEIESIQETKLIDIFLYKNK